MQIAPLPDNEPQRIAQLQDLGVLDTLPHKAFDDITALASAICDAPIALISLVDRERQWFKSRVGLGVEETDRDVAFCSHAILTPLELMTVEDAMQDPRFHDNPLVTGEPHIRFYAGAPIVTEDGYALGTVCVIDRTARTLTEAQQQALRSLSRLVVNLLEHERIRKKETLRHSEQLTTRNAHLTALSASGLDLMSFIDKDYVYRYVNQTYLSYWGRALQDIVDHNVEDLLGTELFHNTAKPHLDLALAGQSVHFEATIQFPIKGECHVEVTYLPSFDELGQITGVIVRAHDIHSLKLREEQLRQTVAMLEHKTLEQDRFIHIVSHDLREPINTINNFSSLLVDDEALSLPEAARRYLKFVHAGGKRMESLLNDLLTFLHLDQHAVARRPVDFSQLAEQVRNDLDSALKRSGGQFHFESLPSLSGDASLLRIALQNLVANGLKFTRPGVPPIVSVNSSSDRDTVHLHVHDNGIGMQAEQLTQIFEMFKRLHTRKEYDGSGLGLSICRRIAELHDGQISVTSDPGQGSCFTLSLPRVPAQASPPQEME
ncbi:ATP-binding protein [Hydrogenophaga sp.]|uniref:sensor histidine kinase n=1 Tax=Hydrogenophaga sp. TaxID=1904254 RepID=UPI00356568F6